MALVSRLSRVPEAGQDRESIKKIGFNLLVAALAELQRGKISAAAIASQFELDAQEQTQVQALYTKLANLANNNQRQAFLFELQNILYLAEMGFDGSANGGVNYSDLTALEARIAEL